MNRIEYPAALHVRDGGDGRTIEGPLLPWGVEACVLDRGRLVVETFERGALAGVEASRVPLTARHPRDAQELPIGVTVELEERADAAWGAWRVSDTALGNEVLTLARDGVPLGLSVGFMEIPGGSRWSPDRRRVTRTRALLDHVAVVRVPAYTGAGVVGVRAAASATPLLDLARLRRCPVPAIGGGPTGRPWRRVRARVLAASDVCYLCGHPGAGAVDHVISRKVRPDLALDLANLRPVHGSLSRCPWCKQACNEVKGDRPGLLPAQQPRESRRW